MKTQLEKKKTQTLSNTTKTENVSEKTQNTSQNPFLSGNENTTNPFTKSAPAQFAGLGGFLKAGKRLAGNVFAGKGINASIEDVKKHNAEKKEQKSKEQERKNQEQEEQETGGNMSVQYALKNPKLRDMFAEFLEKEHNVETLECYELLQRVKKHHILFMDMYTTYLKPKSKNEVNLPGKIQKKCITVADKLQNNPLGQDIDTSLLDDIDYELIMNMTDPLDRFIFTDEYANRHKV